MTQKVRKTLIMIVMAALIICLMAASLTYTFTYGRYAGGKFDEESPYDDLIEFVGANQYTVRTPEELIQAIEDGYSNIKIADDAEEPFVIDTGVTDVSANLVLDLNGTNVIRNSRNPLLDVKEEVSVVLVYDSAKTAGSFYNPVGSNLQVSGGTLTVAVGDYISGPEDGEYNTKTESASEVTLFKRDNTDRADSTGYTSDSKVGALPAISTDSTDSTDSTNFTNKYFEKVDTGTTFDTNYIKDDTFLLYTVERDCFVGDGSTTVNGVTSEKGMLYTNAEQTGEGENRVLSAEQLTVACNVASCDFYYYYPTGGTAGTKEAPQDYAVIYGYWDVKALAKGQYDESKEEYKSFYNSADLVWPYAAVRMVEGEGIVRGGTFSNHFDVAKSYGIYAEGGTLSVSKNTTVDTTFTTGGEGVCIRVQSATGETTTTGEATTTGGSLTISGGEFSSEIGNTIEMSGGKMNVTAGKFTKSAAKGIGSDGDDGNDGADQIANQTAIIDIEDGTLKIEGKSADSVKLTAGGAVTNPDDGTVTYSGTLQNVFGIRAEGGTVTASGCTFNISGDYSAGVLSYNGEINLGDDTSITVTQSDEVKDNGNTLLTSAGVSSEQASGDGEHPVNLSGNVTIISNGLGITARGTVKVTGGTTSTVTTSRGTGIYVNNGSFNVDIGAAITVNSTVKSGYSWATPPGNTAINTPNIYNGVYVQGGSLVSEGTLNVTFTGVENDAYNTETDNGNANTSYLNQRIKSYAVRVEGGDGTDATIASGTITNSVGGGVYVGGGTVTLGVQNSNSGPTVVTTGTVVDAEVSYGSEETTTWRYWWSRTGGDAVKVVDGSLTIYGGEYRAAQGNGIFVNGGTASEGQTYAVQIQNGTFFGADGGSSAQITGPAASYAIKVADGSVSIKSGTFGNTGATINNGAALFMGTSNDNRGTIQVEGGTFGGRGADTIVIYRYANVTLNGPTVRNTGSSAVSLTNDYGYTNDSNRGSSVTITGGTYSGGNDAVWYGCSADSLSITGGTFTGTNQYGMYFYVDPGSNVGIIGGTFTGADTAFNAGGQTSNGDIYAPNIFELDGTDGWCYDESNNAIYSKRTAFSSEEPVGGGMERDLSLSDWLTGGIIGSSRLIDYRTIIISTTRP